MIFKGRLQVPSEPSSELRVSLLVEAGRLALASGQQQLGTWGLDEVEVRRLGGDRFAVTVAGEDLHFVADDTLSFAYSGVPAITRTVPLETRKRKGWFARMSERPPIEPEDRWLAAVPDPLPAPMPEASDTENEELPPPVDESDHLLAEIEEIIHEEVLDEEPAQVSGQPFWTGRQRIIDIPEFVEIVADENVQEPAHEAIANQTVAAAKRPTIDVSENHCVAQRADGSPCRAPVAGISGYCFQHDPDRESDREDARRRAAAVPRDPVTRMRRDGDVRLAKIFARLEEAMERVERGELPPERAQALAQLARTMCAILDTDEPAGR